MLLMLLIKETCATERKRVQEVQRIIPRSNKAVENFYFDVKLGIQKFLQPQNPY